MQSDEIGPVGGLTAYRPILVSLVLAVGLTALAAVAYRPDAIPVGAPQSHRSGASATHAFEHLTASAAIFFIPVLFAAIAPRRRAARLALAGVLVGLAMAAPSIGNVLLGMHWRIGDPVAIVGVSFAAAAVMVVGAPLWRPGIRFLAPGLLGVLLAAAGVHAFAALIARNAIGEALAGAPTTAAVAAAGEAMGVIVLTVLVFRYAAAFAAGGDGRQAAARAAGDTASLAAFAGAALVVGFAPSILAGGRGAQLSAAVATLIAAAPALAAVLIGGGGVATAQSSERTAYDENVRCDAVRRAIVGVRPYLPPNVALAFVSVAAIAALVALFDQPEAFSSSELAAVAGAAVFGAAAFVTVRGGLALGGLTGLVAVLTGWIAALVGASVEDVPRAAALAVFAVSAAPVVEAWRAARSPRLKARDVTARAMTAAAPAFTLSAVFAVIALLAADASAVWPEADQAAAYFAALWAVGFILIAPWLTAVGAIFGRR